MKDEYYTQLRVRALEMASMMEFGSVRDLINAADSIFCYMTKQDKVTNTTNTER